MIITVLTLMVGDHRFNGAGMDMALEAVEGNADWYSSVLKLFFTAVSLAPGFKGGEIVLYRRYLRMRRGRPSGA